MLEERFQGKVKTDAQAKLVDNCSLVTGTSSALPDLDSWTDERQKTYTYLLSRSGTRVLYDDNTHRVTSGHSLTDLSQIENECRKITEDLEATVKDDEDKKNGEVVSDKDAFEARKACLECLTSINEGNAQDPPREEVMEFLDLKILSDVGPDEFFKQDCRIIYEGRTYALATYAITFLTKRLSTSALADHSRLGPHKDISRYPVKVAIVLHVRT